MKRNLIIKAATWILYGSLVVLAIVLLSLVAMGIHWHMDKSFYENFYLVNGFQAGLDSFRLKISHDHLPVISLADVSNGTIYWILIRNSIIIIIFILIVKKMLDILRSIRDLNTFYEGNVTAFRQLALLSLLSALVAFFNFGAVGEEIIWNFTVPFKPIISTAICLTLSEVFKEGKRLFDDSKTII